MIQVFIYYVKMGGGLSLFLFFFPLLFYFLWKLLQLFVDQRVFHDKSAGVNLRLLVRASLFILLGFSITFFLVGLALEWITALSSVPRATYYSEVFMAADSRIFGVYVPFWFQDQGNFLKPFFDFLSPILISVYRSIIIILGTFFVFLLAANSQRFYQAILVFFLTVVVSLPLWYLMPAFKPADAYLDNILQIPLSNDIQTTLSVYKPSPRLVDYLGVMRKARESKKEFFYDLTAFPSMHVAWTTTVLYFGIATWRLSAIILVPYFILNFFSTMFTLQHYAVDAVAGLFVTVLAIILAETIARRGVPKSFLVVTILIQKDLRALWNLLKDFGNQWKT